MGSHGVRPAVSWLDTGSGQREGRSSCNNRFLRREDWVCNCGAASSCGLSILRGDKAAISSRSHGMGGSVFRTDVRLTTPERSMCGELRKLGIEPHPLPTAFNIFMTVDVRAEMDLAIAVSSCPASGCNGGAPPRPLALEIL